MSERNEMHRNGNPAELLNGICPYFTMFPLDFPLKVLKRRASTSDKVLDPFCGRGTTNFAARVLGLDSMGIDSNPVAVAISAAKMVSPQPEAIASEAKSILQRRTPKHVPEGDFWSLAYHPQTLDKICRLREGLMERRESPERIALRGIVLGALHGPIQRTTQSYFSNQSPRTYAPKPRYATKFWKAAGMQPPQVDCLDVIRRRAIRYYSTPLHATGRIRNSDSRNSIDLDGLELPQFDWVITSPPYYGMRTYVPDQWLRNWFLGGPSEVDYDSSRQISHTGRDRFITDLKAVWRNSANVSTKSAKLVIRFGGIPDRNHDPKEIVKASLAESGWKINTLRQAGTASEGKRQADSFLRIRSKAIVEYDVWAERDTSW